MSAGHFDDPIPFTIDVARKVLSIAAVAARMRLPYRIVTTKDIPYLAGYSKDGMTFYIDRDLPLWPYHHSFVATNRFLLLHERAEKALIDTIDDGDAEQLYALLHVLRMHSPQDRLYYHCHGVATAIEQNEVEMAYGKGGLESYNRFMRGQVKRAEDERIREVPRDLDMTPYQGGDEMDRRLREVMERRMV